uniref:Uncharacterized protein n=1 Tax=Picea glauca TaxID=3330 RepID=A0A101M5C8_PICGL|nr:hypothetical protein ABT39_MTgene1020 [Picea glauca]
MPVLNAPTQYQELMPGVNAGTQCSYSIQECRSQELMQSMPGVDFLLSGCEPMEDAFF